jgi:hypothetical protein
MRVQIAIPEEHVNENVINAGLEAVTRINEQLIRSGQAPTFEQAIRNGIKWRPEPPGDERFDHAGLVTGRGWGDCDDLAPYKAASDRVTGKDPRASAIVVRSGPSLWHAITKQGDGSTTDPSVQAGMPKPPGSAVNGYGFRDGMTSAPAKVVGIGPAVVAPMWRMNRPAVAVLARKNGHSVVGWDARADLPWGINGHALTVTSFREHPRLALHDAIAGACSLGHVCGGANGQGVDPISTMKLAALDCIVQGMAPAEVYRQLAPQGWGPLLQNGAVWQSIMGTANAIRAAGCC